MPFNGSGTFTRVYNWATDAAGNIPITASRVDTEDTGFATGLSTVICKDGQTTCTAQIPFAAGIKTWDGTVSSPAIAFTAELGSGFYRVGAGDVGFAVTGTQVVDYKTGTVTISPATASTTTSTGALVVTGGVGIGGAVNAAGDTKLTSATASTTASTGALVVTGGVGIGGALNVSGTLGVTGAATLSSTLAVTGNTTLSGTLGVTGNITTSAGLLGITNSASVSYIRRGAVTASGVTCALDIGYEGGVIADGIVFKPASGATSTPAAFLYSDGTTVGTIQTTNVATTYNTSSDARLKTDPKQFDGLSIVASLKPYDFEWKATQKRAHGVYAQEAFEVYPEAVSKPAEDERNWEVDYSKFVPVLIRAIQQLQDEIKELKK